MSEMRTVGVDMSTNYRSIGFVTIDWTRSRPGDCLNVPVESLAHLVDLLEAEVKTFGSLIAVDVPFGWPTLFSPWLVDHGRGVLGGVPKSVFGESKRPWLALASRKTDLVARERLGKNAGGFSVSFDKLGATAACWAYVEADLKARGVPIDRSGQRGQFLETWPSAVWRLWNEPGCTSPPHTDIKRLRKRLAGVVDLSDESWSKPDAALSHAKDALVCALLARAVFDPAKRKLAPDHADSARGEGWIHLPPLDSALVALQGGPA